MNRTDLFEAIRFAINRGHTLDDNILPAMRKAVLWFERNYNLAYMHRWVTFTVSSVGEKTNLIPMPPRIKGLNFIRFLSKDGKYTNPRKVHPSELAEEVKRNMPLGFWMDGNQHIVFESLPTEPLDGQLGYWRFTDFSTIGPEDSHWLFDFAEDVMVARVMVYMAPIMKAPELVSLWENDLMAGLKTLLAAEEEFKEGPTGASKMLYGEDL